MNLPLVHAAEAGLGSVTVTFGEDLGKLSVYRLRVDAGVWTAELVELDEASARSVAASSAEVV